jgi:hypothetical protein
MRKVVNIVIGICRSDYSHGISVIYMLANYLGYIATKCNYIVKDGEDFLCVFLFGVQLLELCTRSFVLLESDKGSNIILLQYILY